jgi:hypothetical protein
MTTTVESLLARAASQIGTMERTGHNDVLYADYWGITGYSWCYAFVQWCFETDGAELPFRTMYVPAGVAWSRENGQSVERGSSPQPGDIVHFTWSMSEWPPDRAGTGDHVGIVESWNGADTITTIEGNVGSPQGVYRMRRSINATVINYWRPPVYDDGSFGTAAVDDDLWRFLMTNDELTKKINDIWGTTAATRVELSQHVGGIYTRIDQSEDTVQADMGTHTQGVYTRIGQLEDHGDKTWAGESMGAAESVSVEQALKAASPSQLFAELNARLGK